MNGSVSSTKEDFISSQNYKDPEEKNETKLENILETSKVKFNNIICILYWACLEPVSDDLWRYRLFPLVFWPRYVRLCSDQTRGNGDHVRWSYCGGCLCGGWQSYTGAQVSTGWLGVAYLSNLTCLQEPGDATESIKHPIQWLETHHHCGEHWVYKAVSTALFMLHLHIHNMIGNGDCYATCLRYQ